MTLMPCRLSGRRLVLFALFAFSLFALQPPREMIAAGDQPTVCVVPAFLSTAAPTRTRPDRPSPSLVVSFPKSTIQGFPIPIPRRGSGEKKNQTKISDVLSKLSKLGPIFPAAAYSMSNFSVAGFVKDKWPIVVVYELEADSTAEVTISSSDGKLKFPITLTPATGERREVKIELPVGFGKQPQLGVVSFKAFKNGPEPIKTARFFLYGLGVGDKAVGSMVIDQLKFQPPNIRPKLKEKASYSFHSRSDFDTVSVEFRRLKLSSGVVTSELAASQTLTKGVRPGELVTNVWDGKDSKGKLSPGPHQFFVHAWRGLKRGADWVFAAEEQLVTVE